MADKEWCIGCGVCAVPCPSGAVKLVRRSSAVPPKDFRTLHEQILKEGGSPAARKRSAEWAAGDRGVPAEKTRTPVYALEIAQRSDEP